MDMEDASETPIINKNKLPIQSVINTCLTCTALLQLVEVAVVVLAEIIVIVKEEEEQQQQ